jgi:medium-chain acyl-[acyl-carrier-protein] hydrolase
MMTSAMMQNPAATPWLSMSRPNPRAKLRLFCFPYAGGAASIYRNWARQLPEGVEVCPVQLPGRGGRIKEAPFSKLPLLIDALAASLAPFLDKPFAFFGHSLGALVGFELAHRLRAEHGSEPLHLFVSGRRAPQLPEKAAPTYSLSEAEFVEELRRLNGTPAEVLEHPELLGLLVPLLRADFELCENYQHTSRTPLDCPITALGGLSDVDVPRHELEPWREHTTGSFTLRMLPGDHFFLNSAEFMVLQMVARQIYKTPGELNIKPAG